MLKKILFDMKTTEHILRVKFDTKFSFNHCFKKLIKKTWSNKRSLKNYDKRKNKKYK